MQTLFTSDRMIVQGEVYDTIMSGNDSETVRTPYIRLNFIFQVNGKMTQYELRMELENGELKDWNPWNSIIELFFSMGYKFDDGITPTYSIIKSWIKKMTDHPDYIYQN